MSASVTAGAGTVTTGTGSPGIFAQSVGGGGGNGGAYSSAATAGTGSGDGSASTPSSGGTGTSASTSSASGVAVSMGIGGLGGGGGGGGSVTASTVSPIETYGAQSHGLFVQSIGGGGGNGGASVTNANSGAFAVGMGLGGFGGIGGAGGNASASTTSTISTIGTQANGIFVQSIGGGGGSGGASSATSAGAGDANISMAIGGFAGAGQAAGTAIATTGTTTSGAGATVSTMGTEAIGILVQSIGGGGGSGGASLSSASDGKVTAALGLGGSGGSGGIGNNATIYPYGSVETSGANAPALMAQSIGGGGGNGGSATSSSSGTGTAVVSLLVGGSGSGGGAGGSATIDTSAYTGATLSKVVTTGANAHGMFAQSVGGGGGNGGSANTSTGGSALVTVSLGLGGAGSGGGAGGTANVNNLIDNAYGSSISTSGPNANGILSQSIGGGGGNGGSSDSLANSASYQASFTIGGSGGTGGIGGEAKVSNGGTISTTGAGAYDILAQSVGGGGGNARAAAGMSGGTGAIALNFAIGGSGGTGQNGGTVTVTNRGQVSSTGPDAVAIGAQSIGGGGGNGGFALSGGSSSTLTLSANASLGGSGSAGGNGGSASVTNYGIVSTTGSQSAALFAQSIGGGGGRAGVATSSGSTLVGGLLSLGGTGGATGKGGSATVYDYGSVTTSGDMAHGMFAQSIGGGGGQSAMRSSSVVLGGPAGGAGGAASAFTYSGSSITTSGAAAIGLLAQSVGGGGGVGTATSSATLGAGTTSQPSSIGGAVTVTTFGPITTTGVNAVGILAQSVGGGGGVVLSTGDAVTPTFRPGNGNGGTVTVTIQAPVTTSGAYAVIAQSVGGGGGLVATGTNTFVAQGGGGEGAGEPVTVNNYSTVKALGSGTTGIYTASNKADPTVYIAPGASVSGGPGGAGVVFDGPSNLLTNEGEVSTADGANGMAVRSLAGDITVNNSGVIRGSVALASGGAQMLHNLASGTLLAGSFMDLGGAGGVLHNDGVLSLGAAGVSTTRINGSLVQGGSGVLQVKLDKRAGLADQVAVDGSVQLAGVVRPQLINQGVIVPGKQSNPVVVASGDLTSTATTTSSTAIQHYDLAVSGRSLLLNSETNFTPPGLSGLGSRIGDLIGTIQEQGGSPLMQEIAAALVTLPDTASLDGAYKRVSGDGASAAPQAALGASAAAIDVFTDRMDSWRVNGMSGTLPRGTLSPEVAGGGPDHPYRVWATMLAAGSPNGGLSGQLYGGAGGVDGQMRDLPILVGGGVSLSQTLATVSSTDARVNATNFGASLYGVGRIGAGYLSAIGYLGGGNSSLSRNLYALGLNLSTSVRFAQTVAAARLEGGYSFPLGTTGVHITPFLAVQPMQVWQSGADESFGSQGAGLHYDPASITALPVFMGVQFDAPWHPRPDMTLNGFLRLAWMHDFLPERDVTRSFAELPGATFTSTGTPVVSNAAVIRAGVQYALRRNVSLFASVDSELSSNYKTVGGSFGAQWQW